MEGTVNNNHKDANSDSNSTDVCETCSVSNHTESEAPAVIHWPGQVRWVSWHAMASMCRWALTNYSLAVLKGACFQAAVDSIDSWRRSFIDSNLYQAKINY